MGNKKKRLLDVLSFAYSNSGSLFLMKSLGIAVNYIALLLILHFFDFQGNGELANFVAQAKVLMIVFVFGLDIVLIKRINEIKRNITSILDVGKTLIINFIIGTLLFLIISTFIKVDFLYLVGGIVLAIWRFCSHFYRGKNNMFLYGFFEFITFQASVLIGVFIAWYTSMSLINTIILVNIIFASIFLGWFFITKRKEIINNFSLKINFKQIIKQYKESFHFVLSSSILITSTSVLYYIIKTSYSTATLGVYDSILKFSLVITLPLIATNGRVMVLTSKYYNNKEMLKLKEYINKTTKMLAYMSTFFALAVILGYFVYSEFFNDSFKSYWTLFLFLVLAQLINNWAGPVGVVLQLTDNEKIYNLITFSTSLYLVISTIIIAKYLPINYIAGNYIFYMFLQNGASLLLVKKRLNINPYRF